MAVAPAAARPAAPLRLPSHFADRYDYIGAWMKFGPGVIIRGVHNMFHNQRAVNYQTFTMAKSELPIEALLRARKSAREANTKLVRRRPPKCR